MNSVRSRLAGMMGASSEPPQVKAASKFCISDVVDGELIQRGRGCVFIARDRYRPDDVHSYLPETDFIADYAATLKWLVADERFEKARVDDVLFFDLETTGFGGAGCYPFLIGLGWFEDGSWHQEQLFLCGPSHEEALLRYLLERFGHHRVLSSFNGRTFDVHILRDRCTLHRLPFPWETAPHYDVLFPARALWRRRYPNCRLQTLERYVLGLDRGDDVDGYLIPTMYCHYVSSGDSRGLAAIFRHNRQDVLTLVGLARAVLSTLHDPLEAPPPAARSHRRRAEELVAAGVLHLRKGHADMGVRCIQEALSAGVRGEGRRLGCWELSMYYKRQKAWAECEALWRRMIDDRNPSWEPFEELAKCYEHVHRDFHQALLWVQRALDRFPYVPELHRRKARLERRTQV